jgi:hypothetical protein
MEQYQGKITLCSKDEEHKKHVGVSEAEDTERDSQSLRGGTNNDVEENQGVS